MSTIKVQNIQHTASSSNAISLASDGTCTANITNNLSNRNLVINGAMQVAQRGTSSTTSGYGTVDRWQVAYNNTDNAITQSQVDVASGTTPYSLGFRKALKATNGNQTSGAANDVQVLMYQKIEAQDIANSGWNYTDPNSKITLSFWVKSSVAQNFYIRLVSIDGTLQNFPSETGSLTADTWTKVTKTISGNSNLTFDNNTDQGLQILFDIFMGTNYTDSGVSLDTWAAYASGTRTPDQTSTWYTTNNATFELTGVQLEVSDHATSFQFRSFAEELALCQRYYVVLAHQDDSTQRSVCNLGQYSPSTAHGVVHFPVQMRIGPSMDATSGGGYYVGYGSNAGQGFDAFALQKVSKLTAELSTSLARTQGDSVFVRTNANGAKVAFQAEL